MESGILRKQGHRSWDKLRAEGPSIIDSGDALNCEYWSRQSSENLTLIFKTYKCLFFLTRKSGMGTFHILPTNTFFLTVVRRFKKHEECFSRHPFSGIDHSNKNFSALVCSKVYLKNKDNQLTWGTKTYSDKNIFTSQSYIVFKFKYII